MGTANELKAALKVINSDPDAIQRAETLYGQLEKLVENTPALVRVRSLPRSEYLFSLPVVRKVVVFVFDRSEFESFTYSTQALEMSSERVNEALLNFSSEEECRGAK
ncbi:MAG TPA: hypothetical protein VMU80_16970 [Bryobacteraceae bacterium]|nr:hypothetical protein [Bryobacteraceae bacterium]HUO30920.1 hypothetical protein [Bryobacteraceae bacterium]